MNFLTRILLVGSLLTGGLWAKPPIFKLPTENDALFRGDLAAFYMPTHLTQKPPQSGSWGFVRNIREFSAGKVYTRFHEGIDIRPLHRNARKIPTDRVCAIANGVVVHVNASTKYSNYGKYVVVEHRWGEGPFYSLYSHLASVQAHKGQKVKAGTPLGILGSTGRGLGNARAHLHLELNILWSTRFDDWCSLVLGSTNAHGNYNGINLSGLDLAEVYLKQRKKPKLSFAQLIYSFPQHYRITLPRKSQELLPIAKRYPWLQYGKSRKTSPSWEIAFTRSGFPVGIAPSQKVVSKPTVTFVRSSRIDHRHYTIKRLTGTGSSATLTKSGLRFLALVTDDFPSAPTPSPALTTP